MAYRTPDLLVSQHKQTINVRRAYLAKQSIVAPTGPALVWRLAGIINRDGGVLSPVVCDLARPLLDQIAGLAEKFALADLQRLHWGVQ